MERMGLRFSSDLMRYARKHQIAVDFDQEKSPYSMDVNILHII